MKSVWIITSGFDHMSDPKALRHVSQLLTNRPEDSFLIAADGGANLLFRLRIVPDRIAGDMDSISEEALCFYRNNIEFDLHPVQKDETDAELAMEQALAMNPESIVIFNSMQQRFDQTFAILALLERAMEKNIPTWIETGTQEIMLATKNNRFEDAVGKTISLAPLSKEVTGVRTTGFKYPLNAETLYRDRCRGISNIVIDTDAEMCYESGELLIIISHNREAR